MDKIGGRFIIKKSNIPNRKPTIPPNDKHTSGLWVDTDIYDGELYINTFDDRMWFRNNKNQIIEIPTLSIDNLKIKDINLPDMFGKLNYKGILNGELNQISVLGDYYIINNNTIINGIKYTIGDFIVYNGNGWEKVDNSNKNIYISDIICDSDNKKLNDIISELYNGILTNEISLKYKNQEFFKVDNDNFIYKNKNIFHNGNSNTLFFDWSAKNLISKTFSSETVSSLEIYSKLLKTDNLETTKINSKEIISNSIITEKIIINSGKIELNDKSIYIEGNGIGFGIYHLLKPIINFNKNSNNINIYNKMKYNDDFLFIDDLDIVNKKYVDDEINKTFDIDIEDLNNNCYRLGKNIKYINIDIWINTDIELILDDYNDNDNSKLVVLCVESENNNIFNILLKYNNELVMNINKNGIITMYFNSKNKKWYKLS